MQPLLLCACLLTASAVMAVVSGMNDGGVLMALPVRYPVVPVGYFMTLACGILLAGPLLLGRSVARTLQAGLFGSHDGAQLAFLVGVMVALTVVLLLSHWRLPTSLTLALVGGLTGAGSGAGLAVAWSSVVRVLLIGAAAPAVGAVTGWLIGRLTGIRQSDRRRPHAFRSLHLSAFALQCLAYSVNDGQKMLAVAAVALASTPGGKLILEPGANGWIMLSVMTGLTVLFCVGMLVSIRRVATHVALGLATLRPVDAISAEISGAVAVLASSAAGTPVSMTQAAAGGVVGAVSSKGLRRVRWDAATRLAAGWLVTLPISVICSFVLGVLTRHVT